MKKEKIKNIVLIIVVAVISSTVTSFATSNYLFDSVDVKYDNSNGVQAETVQGAIDELYSCASDYSSLNNKLNGYFKNNPTSYFDGEWLKLNSSSTSLPRGTIIYDANNKQRSSFMYDVTTDTTYLDAYTSTSAFGKLNLRGNPVQINGVDVSNVSKGSATINSSNTSTSPISVVNWVKIGKVVIVNFYDVSPINSNNTYVLASNLPKSAGDFDGNICQPSSSSQSCYRIHITTGGTNIYWWWTTGGSNAAKATGQLIYISSE